MDNVDKHYIIGEMIRKRLNEVLPHFEANGLEHRLFKAAQEDFLNYLAHIWFGEFRYFSGLDPNNLLTQEEILDELIMVWLNEGEKAVEDLGAWLNLWLNKWRERVKILFTQEDQFNKNQETLQSLVRRGTSILSYDDMKQYREPVLFTFLSHGEIAGTEVLTDTVIKKEAGRLKKAPGTVEEKVVFINSCIREARSLSQTSGKLIYITVKDWQWEVRR